MVSGGLLYSCVSWGVFTAVVVVRWSVVLLCFVGCFHSSSSGLGGLLYSCVSWGVFTAVVVVWVVCCTLVFRGVFSQQ